VSVVVVTGGMQGIGAAIVDAFASQGDRVAVLDIDERSPYRCDVSNAAQVESAAERVESELGPVEVLKTELFAEPIRADYATFIKSAEGILHVEFQFSLPGTGDTPLPLRMLDYFVRLHRRYRVPVTQVLVLVKATSVPTPAVFEVSLRTSPAVFEERTM